MERSSIHTLDSFLLCHIWLRDEKTAKMDGLIKLTRRTYPNFRSKDLGNIFPVFPDGMNFTSLGEKKQVRGGHQIPSSAMTEILILVLSYSDILENTRTVT